MHAETLHIATKGPGLYDLTPQIADFVHRAGIARGLCFVFVQHTSASLVLQENADPAVHRDLERWMTRLAPRTDTYEHDDEGPDDMPAHLRSAVTRTSETIPISDGKLALGTWQGIYLWEHRDSPHKRRVVVTLLGDPDHAPK